MPKLHTNFQSIAHRADSSGVENPKRIRSNAVTFAALAFIVTNAGAADYSWTPQAKLMTRVDDNVRGASRSPETAWGFDTGASINFLAQTAEITSELIPRVNARRFAVGDNLDADEYSIIFNNKWRLEKLVSAVNFMYARDSTLTTEATDTGLRNDVTDRDTITVTPSVYYAVSDRLTAHCDFLFSDVAYLTSGATGLVGYTYLQGSAGLQYQWNDRVESFVTITTSDFNAATVESSTRTYSAQIGGVFHWDPTLDLTASMGWNVSAIDFVSTTPVLVLNPVPHVEQARNPNSVWVNGPVAMVSIQKFFESSNLRIDYSRAVSPSGRGSQSSADRLEASASRKWSDRLTLTVAALYEMRSSQAQNIRDLTFSQDLNRDYSEARTSLRYRIGDEWATAVSFRYGYRKSTGGLAPDTADTNAVYLSIEYNGMPKRFKGE